MDTSIMPPLALERLLAPLAEASQGVVGLGLSALVIGEGRHPAQGAPSGGAFVAGLWLWLVEGERAPQP